jgi:phospholipid/cholesterol/gamma-HCH transport system substrate-binding protein
MIMYKKFDLFFGFFVIGVFCWFLYSVLVSTLSFSRSYITINANFSSIDGVMEGSVVVISGVKIGEVASVKLDGENFLANVVIKIDGNLKIPTDSIATIESAGLIGAKHIAIYPGSDQTNLKNGDKILQTTGSVNIEKLINNFVSSGFSK